MLHTGYCHLLLLNCTLSVWPRFQITCCHSWLLSWSTQIWSDWKCYTGVFSQFTGKRNFVDIGVLSSELSADRLAISLRNLPPQPLEACADSENETRQQLRQLITLKVSHSHVLSKNDSKCLANVSDYWKGWRTQAYWPIL